MTAPDLKATARADARDWEAACAVRTLARTETCMPMNPARADSTAPIANPNAAVLDKSNQAMMNTTTPTTPLGPSPATMRLDSTRCRCSDHSTVTAHESSFIGQVAGILHGSCELTGDLDMLWSGAPDEASAIAAALSAAGASLFDDDGQPLPAGVAALSLPKLTFRSPSAAGDCCTSALPWGQLDVGSFVTRADSCVVDGVRLHYLTRPDLNAMRLAVGRPKDLRRVAELEQLYST